MGIPILILLKNTQSLGEFGLPTLLHSVVEPREKHICSGSVTQNSVIYPLRSSCFTCNDNSKRIKCAAGIVSARLNVLLQVLCSVDKVHLKRMRKYFKICTAINTLFH